MKKVKGCFCLFLSLALCSVCFCFWGISASASVMTAPTLNGKIYSIVSSSNLRWVAGVCSGEVKAGTENYPLNPSFSGYTLVMKNDISVGNVEIIEDEYTLTSGENWVPIGTEKTPFSGVFDGTEFKVSGVFVCGTEKYNGFFGNVSSGTIQNLSVEGYVEGKANVGGIVGRLYCGKISDCAFLGKVNGGEKTGGIVGEIIGTETNPSEVFLSVASCDITTFGGSSAGGVAGEAQFTNILSCSSGGTLYSFSINTGGILGTAFDGVLVDCCSSKKAMSADGEETVAGGILGASLSEVLLKNNSFEGIIYCSGKNVSLCGGIVGSYTGKIENSFVSGTVCSSLYFDETDENSEEAEAVIEKICVSSGIAAKGENAIINNCYFSGTTECEGIKGNDIYSDKWNTEVNNAYYSKGIASYVLHGTEESYGVAELLSALKKWVTDSGEGYSPWVSVSGINNTAPLLKYTYSAQGNENCIWKIEDTVFTFYTNGCMEDYSENRYGIIETPWAVYRTTAKTVNIKEGVTRIGNNAFNDFSNLRTLTLPSTIKEIGNYAFEQCVYLKNFTLPEGLSDIGDGAFRKCKAITKIVLPKGIRAVRKYTFSYCENLSSVSIPESVSLIGYKAFAACDSLVSISLPQSVREIDGYSFYWCEKLSSVSLPYTLNRIGEYAFGKCEVLTNFDIPKGTTVEENAFWSELPKGDVDGDGRYTAFDYIKIKAHFLGTSPMSKAQIKAADSNFDGIITTTDYIYVKMVLMGKI